MTSFPFPVDQSHVTDDAQPAVEMLEDLLLPLTSNASAELPGNGIVYSWNSALGGEPPGLEGDNMWIVKYVTIVAYLLTFVIGLAGNTLVLYVIGQFPVVRRKSVANYYIWNLALADELYVLALPIFCWATYRFAIYNYLLLSRQ